MRELVYILSRFKKMEYRSSVSLLIKVRLREVASAAKSYRLFSFKAEWFPAKYRGTVKINDWFADNKVLVQLLCQQLKFAYSSLQRLELGRFMKRLTDHYYHHNNIPLL